MGFLSKVEGAGEMIVTLDEVYKGDPQYQKLVDSVAELIRRLSRKFQMNNDKELLEFFIKHLREEI